MKITICGSLYFIDEIMRAKVELEKLGHSVETPPTEVPGENGQPIPVAEMYVIYKNAKADDAWVWKNRERAMNNHNRKIEYAEAVLIMNLEKNGVAGYIGSNTLLEMGLAFYLGKKIYLFAPVPDQPAKE
ncbi:MAG: hypothetical protein AAB429_03225, partial [Patescibacteria group bacterium]